MALPAPQTKALAPPEPPCVLQPVNIEDARMAEAKSDTKRPPPRPAELLDAETLVPLTPRTRTDTMARPPPSPSEET